MTSNLHGPVLGDVDAATEASLTLAERAPGLVDVGDLDDDAQQKAVIAEAVSETLKAHGFVVEWDGNPEERLSVPGIDWKRRTGN